MKRKIFDCITYFRENKQFNLRFNILKNYVDYFIVCESLEDHQGKKKKLNFNINNFKSLKKKIIYLLCPGFPKGLDPWQRQAFQREYIFNGLDKAKPDDYIIFSDPDEIPNPKVLIQLKLKKRYGIFMQNSYCYKINLLNSYETPWEGSRICKRKYLKSIDWLRQKVLSKNLKYPFFRVDKEKRIQLIPNGGWHFNSLMSPKEISLKLRTFAHNEFSSNKFSSINVIKKKIKNREDLFLRNQIYDKINIDKSYPHYILKNINLFKKFIYK
jgi:beta-1,4-mannosyl-glycoprotein beta-1,4-N-acetylglucosaminyltransferase